MLEYYLWPEYWYKMGWLSDVLVSRQIWIHSLITFHSQIFLLALYFRPLVVKPSHMSRGRVVCINSFLASVLIESNLLYFWHYWFTVKYWIFSAKQVLVLRNKSTDTFRISERKYNRQMLTVLKRPTCSCLYTRKIWSNILASLDERRNLSAWATKWNTKDFII